MLLVQEDKTGTKFNLKFKKIIQSKMVAIKKSTKKATVVKLKQPKKQSLKKIQKTKDIKAAKKLEKVQAKKALSEKVYLDVI